MRYPIGIQDFEQIIADGYVYVDKTDLVYQLTHQGKIYFLSRPRRFGKSLLVSTLKYYYFGRRDLFKGLAIDSLETEWAQYPVFHIDFNGGNFMEEGALASKIEVLLSSWEEQYGRLKVEAKFGDRFAYVLQRAHRRTGRRAVVLVDEYDKPILDVLDSGRHVTVGTDKVRLEDINRDILKGFYSVFKLADQDLQFVLLTGVTKFSQVSVFSGFNQPNDISMAKDYETLCGITEEEIDRYFPEAVALLAEDFGDTTEKMQARLKRQYDGYHFSARMTGVYNPFSLLNCFAKREIRDYWFASGTPTYLIRLLAHSKENLNELTGRYYDPAQFIDYKADTEKPLPMIYQSGYLTIKDWKMRRNTFLLDFPNNEVKRGFLTMLAADYLKPRQEVTSWMSDALDALEDGDLELFMRHLTALFADIPYTMRRKENEREQERYFHYTFYLLLRILGTYTVYTEKEQSQGRVDCIVETPDYVYIFEFKLNGSAAEALRQIEEKGYARPYAADPRRLFRVGASFSSETGTVEEWAVE